jgi:hypothetical protein
LDGADLLVVCSVNRSAFHLVTANEISGFSIFNSHDIPPTFLVVYPNPQRFQMFLKAAPNKVFQT